MLNILLIPLPILDLATLPSAAIAERLCIKAVSTELLKSKPAGSKSEEPALTRRPVAGRNWRNQKRARTN